MNPAIWLCILLPIIIVLISQNEEKKTAVILRIKRKKGGRLSVLEMLDGFIGKECLIYTMHSSSQVAGIIRSVKDNWVEVESKGTIELVNADYIVRVREYPTTKSGKKKSVVLD